jgi:tetratricopeptide (TPR) repeat protein
MVDAYTALAQTSKVFAFQEHLLHCGALPMHESLGLLEHFLSTNATARALNVLTTFHMFDAAPDDVKARAAAVLQAHRFSSTLLQQRKAAKHHRTLAKGPEAVSTPVDVAENVSAVAVPLGPPVSAVDAAAGSSVDGVVVPPADRGDVATVDAAVDANATEATSVATAEAALAAVSVAEPLARRPAVDPNATAAAAETEPAAEPSNEASSLSEQRQVAVVVSVDAAGDAPSVDRDAAPVVTAAAAVPVDGDATDAVSPIEATVPTTASAAAMAAATTAAPPAAADSAATAATDAAVSTASTDPVGTAAKSPATTARPAPPKTRPSPQDNLRRVARSYVGMAQSLVQQGDALAAMKKLALALKKVPQFEDALLVRGALYVHQQDYDKAVADLHVVYRLSNETFGNATAGALLCQVAHGHRRRQQWTSAAAVFATLFDVERALGWPLLTSVRREGTAGGTGGTGGTGGAVDPATADAVASDDAVDTDDDDDTVDERASRCMGRDTLLLYADLLGHHLGRFTEAVAVLDALQAAVVGDEQLRPQLQRPLEQRYLVFLEASGERHRADGLYRAALDAGTLAPLDFADVLLRRNDTDAALALYRAEEARLRAELATAMALVDTAASPARQAAAVTAASAAATDATTRRQLLQSRQQVKRAQSSLGAVLKRLGHVHHAVLADGDGAAALYAEAMALGVYDRDVRRYLAAVGTVPTAASSSSAPSTGDADLTAPAAVAAVAAVDAADAVDANETRPDAGDSSDAVMPMAEAEAAIRGDRDADAPVSAEEEAAPHREWHFPHRRLQLPLLFPHFRWVVRPSGGFAHPPRGGGGGGVDRSLQHQQREPRGSVRLGGASMATLLEQLDAAQAEGGQEAVGVYGSDEEEEDDDLIRAGDSPFEQERKRKLQESKAQARREDVERQQRRDSAFFATDESTQL